MGWVESGIDFQVARPSLAPLQRVMLRDSLTEPEAGHHVEQVEIRFSGGVAAERVISAWMDTVARAEALRIGFLIVDGVARSFEFVTPGDLLIPGEPMTELWLEEDRQRPLIGPGRVPWRAVYWAEDRRFLWTFHHALLDGRSIARVLRAFLKRVGGCDAGDLAISRWREPTPEARVAAARIFREMAVVNGPVIPLSGTEGPAVSCLGAEFAVRLESKAAEMEVTAATILIWAWGQALAEAIGTDAVIVEQLRAGAPQEGTAGFIMNTLPVEIPLAGWRERDLRAFRERLLAMREIESVSPEDFSTGVYPDMDGPASSVIMIERGTLLHQVGCPPEVESLVLHEAKGETLMATAYILPDLRLEVEGPGRHGLLEAWIGKLDRGIHPA